MKRVRIADEEFWVRKYGDADYDGVISLWQETGIPCKPQGRDGKETISRELAANPHTLLLVAEKEEVVVATVLATLDGRKGWINRLAVHRDFQRRGLAKLLLKMAEQHLEDLGMEILACLIEDDNPGSMDFFRTGGYVEHREIIYFSKRKYADV